MSLSLKISMLMRVQMRRYWLVSMLYRSLHSVILRMQMRTSPHLFLSFHKVYCASPEYIFYVTFPCNIYPFVLQVSCSLWYFLCLKSGIGLVPPNSVRWCWTISNLINPTGTTWWNRTRWVFFFVLNNTVDIQLSDDDMVKQDQVGFFSLQTLQ